MWDSTYLLCLPLLSYCTLAWAGDTGAAWTVDMPRDGKGRKERKGKRGKEQEEQKKVE